LSPYFSNNPAYEYSLKNTNIVNELSTGHSAVAFRRL
jgi:hypothetical protein